MHKKTSLKDIAQAVGVSTTLVSYVLNNQNENRINKAVAQRIRETAQLLNYQPNQIARSLKTNKSFTLGLVVADIANPFSSSMARIIEDQADQLHYTVLFGSSDEKAHKAQKLISTLLSRQVDGLIIAPSEGMEPQLRALQEQGIPFVLIDRYFPALRTSYVALDNYGAIYQAVEHLLGAGYQRIGMINFKSDLFHLQERSRGYRSALAHHQLPARTNWLKEVSFTNPQAEVAKAMQALTSGPQAVEAIVFGSNVLTLSGLKLLNQRPIRVPDELALVGFDQTDAYELLATSLTYINQPLEAMGQLATSILVESLATGQLITQANLTASLVVQASTKARSITLAP